MNETWFIEWETDPNHRHAPGSGIWKRYAGAFDTYDRALRYKTALCGSKGFWIARYERVEVI